LQSIEQINTAQEKSVPLDAFLMPFGPFDARSAPIHFSAI
jgi:hypothetical protein